jgi:hypothetical protein
MPDNLPESHEVNAYLAPKPTIMIEWFEDIEDFIESVAYSA